MKLLYFLCGLACFSFTQGQTIDLEFDSTQTFQDADVGAIAFGDLDGDGDQDFFATGKGGPIRTTLYLNDGTGQFSADTTNQFQQVFNGDVAVGDLDNDQDLDLLVTGASGSTPSVNLYLNDGAGNFTAAPAVPFVPSIGGEVKLGDLNGDQILDVAMNGIDAQGGYFTKLYLNNGSGTFAEVANSPFEAIGPGRIELVNVDADNDLDWIQMGENASGQASTKLYLNDGAGNFQLAPNTSFANHQTGDIAAADTDNDGDMDFILTGIDDSARILTVFYLNLGGGNFAPGDTSLFPGLFAGVSEFADFDRDGDQDLIHIGSGPGGLINNAIVADIYENLGSNTFVRADSLTGTYISSTAIADVNGDSLPDIAIAGTSSGFPVRATRLYLNQTPILTATAEPNVLPGLAIFPNPNQGTFTLTTPETGPSQVTIHSASGKVVYSKPHAEQPLHLHLAPGLYTVTLLTPTGRQTQKLCITR